MNSAKTVLCCWECDGGSVQTLSIRHHTHAVLSISQLDLCRQPAGHSLCTHTRTHTHTHTYTHTRAVYQKPMLCRLFLRKHPGQQTLPHTHTRFIKTPCYAAYFSENTQVSRHYHARTHTHTHTHTHFTSFPSSLLHQQSTNDITEPLPTNAQYEYVTRLQLDTICGEIWPPQTGLLKDPAKQAFFCWKRATVCSRFVSSKV